MAEYLSPSIGQVMPQLDLACEELTRQTLVRALTEHTKQLCEYDPELADILLEGKKTLSRCVRYVVEQAQKAAVKQAEAPTEKEVRELSKGKVHGREIPMMGLAISDKQVYGWAKAYYYGGSQVEPADAMGNNTPRRKPQEKKGNDKAKQNAGAAESDKKSAPAAGKKKTGKADGSDSVESTQLSLFGNAA